MTAKKQTKPRQKANPKDTEAVAKIIKDLTPQRAVGATVYISYPLRDIQNFIQSYRSDSKYSIKKSVAEQRQELPQQLAHFGDGSLASYKKLLKKMIVPAGSSWEIKNKEMSFALNLNRNYTEAFIDIRESAKKRHGLPNCHLVMEIQLSNGTKEVFANQKISRKSPNENPTVKNIKL